MNTRLRYLFVLLLGLAAGVNGAWAQETYTIYANGTDIYTSSGTETFTPDREYQATASVKLYVGSAWAIDDANRAIKATAQAQNGSGNYHYTDNYAVPTSGGYLVIKPSKTGQLVVNGSKNSGGNKYLVIQSSSSTFVSSATVTCGETNCSWVNDRNSYNVTPTSGALSATFNVQAGYTYYILFNAFYDWSFTGFTFTQQKADIPNADFKFTHSYRNVHSGEAYDGNLLINTYGVPVTYSSSNTAVAEVNSSTGVVTINNVTSLASTTITATFAGNENYNGRTATYSLNVAPALVYTDIPVSALRYRPGVSGISASQMDRQVGGFRLTFSGGDGIKCNNTNNFYFRTNGSGAKGEMTIAMDENNRSEYIKKIVFTAWNVPSLAVGSVVTNSGTLTQTGEKEWTWTNFYTNENSVTFTSQGANDEYILISNIKVYTNNTPTFSKITPVPAFNRSSDSFSTGAAVNISDLNIDTTPSNFLFDYTYDAGNTTLTHTPYTNNTTWPGTIAGTAAEGTATINASFDGSSNPFYNTVASTNVYTLTVSSAAKNTFTWDFTKSLSEVDSKLLNASTDTWQLNDGNWKLKGGDLTGAFTQNGKELEYVYGLQAYISKNDNTMIYGNSSGFRLNSSDSRHLCIPNLKAGDKVTVLCNNYNANRGLDLPSNIKNDGTATGWGNQLIGDFTCVGYVNADDDVDLAANNALTIKAIIVESANNPWPTLSFANGSKPTVEIPYGSTSTTYTNALSNVPAGATVNYAILLDANVGASAASINSGTGELTINATGEVIVRATVSAGTYNSAYYCDYILTVTQASEYASWEYTYDEMEIDGENRPYKGTYTITKSGDFENPSTDRVVTTVPGITMTMGNLSETWYVTTIDGIQYAKTDAATERTTAVATKGNFYKFEPKVNGFLSVTGKNTNGYVYLMDGNSQVRSHNGAFTGVFTDIENYPLIAGTTYYIVSQNYFYLHSFTFRPAFLNPEETAEQTTTFEAYSNTTVFPKLVHDASAGVRFSGNRSVVNLSSDGGVSLVGGGTAIVRGKVISGEHELVAHYTLNANVLSLTSTTPTSGSTITTLENNSFLFVFNENIALADASKVVVMKDAEVQDNITVELADNSIPNYEKTLKISGFSTPLEAGSTYTIRMKEGCVYKYDKDNDNVLYNIANPEEIATFTIESTEPPLTWVYPTTTSAVRIGSSIVLKTSAKIDEGYPSNGVYGTLTYEGGGSDPDYPMTMKAIKDDKNLVFKPTKPMIPNKLYTLTVAANQVKLSGSTNMITKDKVFMFTTGTATGSAPTLVSSTPNANTTNMTYSGGTIEFVFNDNVELEPYSTVAATPVNGSESTAHGTSEKLNDKGILEDVSLFVDANNNKRVYFEYGEDALKYDLYYNLVFPANTVTGPGGMPNTEDIVIKFKMQMKSSGATSVTPATFYPHTWDFNKLGNSVSDQSSAYKIIESAGKQKIDGTKFNHKNTVFEKVDGDGYTTYTSKQNDNNNLFDQGADIYIATAADGTHPLPEFRGIRVSLTKANSGRFEIRKETSKDASNKNLDGTDKWLFRLNGNTHYMTLSNVPEGKLYMVVNTPYLGINSPNATFESVSGATIENNGTLMNTNGTKKVVVNVTSAGDVSFCVKNFNCEKIAVSDYSKTFKSTFAVNEKSYATDCVNENIRYDLVNAFTDDKVKAYYVSATSGNIATATELTETTTSTAASKGGEGVIVVLQEAVGADTEIPFFVTDVNTAVNTSENLLKGTTTKITNFDNSQKNKYFFSNVYTQLSKDKTELEGTPKWITTTQMGFYRAVGSNVSAHKAWLEVSTSGGSARQYYLFKFFDDGETPTAIDGVETKTVNDDAWYSLQGVRVTNPVKGNLYIHNGKKVVIK